MSYIATKYTGVQFRTTLKGDKVYYIRYNNNAGKLVREKIGSDKEGITAVFASKMRAKAVSELRLGDDAPMTNKAESKRKASLTVGDASKMYLDSIRDTSDYKAVVGMYDNHLRKPFGSKLLREVTQADIEKYIASKRKEIAFKTNRPYSTTTIKKQVDLLNTIFRLVIAKEKLSLESPVQFKTKANPIGINLQKPNNARDRFLTVDEIKLLLTTLDKKQLTRNKVMDEDIKMFVRLSLSTGARLNSILNLRKQDINIDNNSVIIKDLKNKSEYSGYLTADTVEAIRSRYNSIAPNEYIIGGDTKVRSKSAFNRILQPILNELFNEGLAEEDAKNRVVIHTFRHTFASLLAISGVSIYEIMRLMNHKKIEMTMRYAKLAPEQGKNAVMSLGF